MYKNKSNGFQKVLGLVLATSGAMALVAQSEAFGSNSSIAMGGQDSGGGNFRMVSTAAEVRRAIEVSQKNITTHASNALHFPPSMQGLWSKNATSWLEKLDSLALSTMGEGVLKIKVDFREKGACRAKDGSATDASTTIGQVGADVCFSIPRLRKIPPADLMRQLVALWGHELAHQSGANESEAQDFQNALLENYTRYNIFDGIGSELFQIHHQASLSLGMVFLLSWGLPEKDAESLLDRAKNYTIACAELVSLERSITDLNTRIKLMGIQISLPKQWASIQSLQNQIEGEQKVILELSDQCRQADKMPSDLSLNAYRSHQGTFDHLRTYFEKLRNILDL